MELTALEKYHTSFVHNMLTNKKLSLFDSSKRDSQT